MEIKILKGQSCYIPGRVNVGLWKDGKDGCFLIDSGGDETSGRRLFRLIQENNLKLRGILNTHSNADHVGETPICKKNGMSHLGKFNRRYCNSKSIFGADALVGAALFVP